MGSGRGPGRGRGRERGRSASAVPRLAGPEAPVNPVILISNMIIYLYNCNRRIRKKAIIHKQFPKYKDLRLLTNYCLVTKVLYLHTTCKRCCCFKSILMFYLIAYLIQEKYNRYGCEFYCQYRTLLISD